MIKCVFLTDLRSKTMTCYTFSVEPTIPESKNVKVTMKKFDEEGNEDFCEEEYFNFEELSFSELPRLKIFKIVVFDQFFIQFFVQKES